VAELSGEYFTRNNKFIMNAILSIHWTLVAAIWYLGNGILHDVFVIIRHKASYDRELLRLLMDGHVLIFSGLILLVCYIMLLNKIQFGAWVSLIIAVGMLVYCGMIFPFLKSFGTMIISLILVAVSIKAMLSFPSMFEIMKPYK